MSKYTITIKNLMDNHFDFGLQDYPIFNEDYRNVLNNKILKHYYIYEIGFETAELFKFYLNERMDLVMDKYNLLYEAQMSVVNNLYGNVDLTETTTSNSESVSTSASNNRNLNQNTPQGKIQTVDLDNQTWASNYNTSKSDINDNSTSTGEAIRRILGNNGKKYNIELLNDIKNNIIEIDEMILNELSDLFMGLL